MHEQGRTGRYAEFGKLAGDRLDWDRASAHSLSIPNRDWATCPTSDGACLTGGSGSEYSNSIPIFRHPQVTLS